jgi:flagellar motor switch protein FliG
VIRTDAIPGLLRAILAATFMAVIGSHQALAQASSLERVKLEMVQNVKNRLTPLLSQYCKEACSIVDVNVTLDEDNIESDDLGFEGVEGTPTAKIINVSRVAVGMQVDDRVSSINRDRLMKILQTNVQDLGVPVDMVWRPVTIPQFGQSAAKEEQLRHELERRMTAAVNKVVDLYCPEDCVLSQVLVDGKLVTPDEASGYPGEELVRDRSGDAILHVNGIEIEVAMNENLPATTRARITKLIQAKTRFAQPVNLSIDVAPFPESFARQQDNDKKVGDDPYGLEKLRQTLKIFREMAGTKEILTTNNSSTTSTSANSSNNSTSNSNSSTSKESAREESNSKIQGQINTNTNTKTLTKDSTLTKTELDKFSSERLAAAAADKEQRLPIWQWMAYLAGFMLLAGTILFVLLKYAHANRDAKMMMYEAQANGMGGARLAPVAAADDRPRASEGGEVGRKEADIDVRRDIGLRLKNEELRTELNRIFVEQPRLAKETFSRLLTEDGVEATARYVHIFGQIVVFELLADPNLQRELYELSEYYHKSSFDFTAEQENRLLTALKTRVTANEIRVLTRRAVERFDFLLQLDAVQIYNLIIDEKPQVQAICMTQLDPKRRRSVFDMYTGQPKVDLMQELCRGEPIPKEFLANIAVVLQRKVTARPEFDVENLRSSEILFDLMDKATLDEQRSLMHNLMRTNPEAARGIKLKLVTVELMPFLKDGHLLEIVLGMEREDLLCFLAGSPEHIRELLLSKAPPELASSWVEDLENFTGGEQNYQFVEMKVTSRIRNLAKSGSINLLALNDLVFGSEAEPLEPERMERGDADVLSGVAA